MSSAKKDVTRCRGKIKERVVYGPDTSRGEYTQQKMPLDGGHIEVGDATLMGHGLVSVNELLRLILSLRNFCKSSCVKVVSGVVRDIVVRAN